MSETISLTFTKVNPSFSIVPVSPSQLPISLVEAVKAVSTVSTTFTWTQTIPLSVWTVPHNLNRFPNVNVCDSSGMQVYADVSYIDDDTVQITHGSAFAGKAYLN